jgi:hypothetical protein
MSKWHAIISSICYWSYRWGRGPHKSVNVRRHGSLGVILETGYHSGPWSCWWITSKSRRCAYVRTAMNCKCGLSRSQAGAKAFMLILMHSTLFQTLLQQYRSVLHAHTGIHLYTHAYICIHMHTYVYMCMPEDSGLQIFISQKTFANHVASTLSSCACALWLSLAFLGCSCVFDNLSQVDMQARPTRLFCTFQC